MSNAIQYIKTIRGPLSTVYYCGLCDEKKGPTYKRTIRKGTRWSEGAGRGAGFRNASRARAEVVKHIHEKHEEEL